MMRVTPGGVHSLERAWGFDQEPPQVIRAEGCRLWDASGREYLDLVMGWGSNLLGHSPEMISEALRRELDKGIQVGFPSPEEYELFKLLRETLEDMEEVMFRFVSSRATGIDLAVRLARAYTQRSRVMVFQGALHGGLGYLMAKTTSVEPLLSVPLDSGTHRRLVKDTVVVPYNDVESFREALSKEGENVAALIVDPLMTDLGLIPISQEMVEAINEAKENYRFIIILDEYLTAFRRNWGYAYQMLGLKPDIIVMGGTMASGMPLAVIAGTPSVMEHLAPTGRVYQSEVLVGNRLSVVAALVTLKALRNSYQGLGEATSELKDVILSTSPIPVKVQTWGASLAVYFTESEVRSAGEAESANYSAYASLWEKLMDEGVLVPPTHLTMWTISAPALKELDVLKERISNALREL